MTSGVTVTNIMADGSICEDLSTYLDTHELPELAKRLIYGFIQDGIALLAKEREENAASGKEAIQHEAQEPMQELQHP